MNDEYWEQYNNDPEFHAYVDAYCKSRGKGIFEALGHITVHETAKYYREKSRDKIIEPAAPGSCDIAERR